MNKFIYFLIFLFTISIVQGVVYIETQTSFDTLTINYYNISTQGKPPYLYTYFDNGSFITFNETKLNSTIDARSSIGNGNSTEEIINAVNGTALNGTKFTSIQWSSLVGRLITSVSNLWFSISSGELRFNETRLNATIDSRSSNLNGTSIVNYVGNWTNDKNYYYNKTEINTINTNINNSINLKLNITDQRYNDTARISTVNSTLTSAINLKLNITDQRYNDTVRINALNLTKLNITDQRYNDTVRISNVNSSLNTKINTVNATQTTNLNNFKTLVANDYFNLSQNEIVTGNIIFNPSVNTTFLNNVIMNKDVYIYGTTFLTDTDTYRVNDSIILTDLSGSTKITLNASDINNKIVVDGDISATNFNGNINASYIQNPYWLELTDQRYNETVKINTVNSTLNTKINNVNTTANVQNLGFNTTTQLKSYFDTIYTTLTAVVSSIGNWTQDKVNYYTKSQVYNITQINNINTNINGSINLKLNITDQRYNDTVRINALNSTKLNINDQRYNETTKVNAVAVNVSNLKTVVNNIATNVSTLNTNINGVAVNVSNLKTVVNNVATNVSTLNTNINGVAVNLSNLKTTVQSDYFNLSQTETVTNSIIVQKDVKAVNFNISSSGRLSGNSTCIILYSPNGNTKLNICN